LIEAGASAPDFTLPDQDGNEVSLFGLRGQRVVLVFYPLDFSPVCSDQLNVYQEVLSDLEGEGVTLLGISVDSAYVHKAFRAAGGLEMTLLADFNPKGQVASAYDVYLEGRGHSSRALVMVGPDGVVEWSYIATSPLEIPGANLIFDAVAAQRAA